MSNYSHDSYTKIKAFNEGKEAYLKGYLESVSPYFNTSTETILDKELPMNWLLGFNKAKEQQNIENRSDIVVGVFVFLILQVLIVALIALIKYL